MPEDAKLRVIANRSDQKMTHVVTVWLCVLDAASRHKNRGTVEVDSEQIAVVQDIDQSIVEAILQAFREKNMIGEDNRLTKWETRQYLSEAERAKKYREGKKEEGAPANEPSPAVTPRHAPSHEGVTDNAESRENDKKAPDTDSRVQNAEAEGRIAESKPDSEKEADLDQKKSDKRLKTHTEKREREREKQKIGGQAADLPQSENHPLQPILEQMLTARRKEQMACRWQEDFQQDIRAWRYYCEIIGASNFCLGKREGREGKAWTIDLSWAVASSDHVARIMEGGFSGGNHPPKPPACNVIALQEAWDSVLRSFEQKYGKPSCRSWLANTVVTNTKSHSGGALVTLQCPNKFSREWLTQHYLADLTHWFSEATKTGARVTAIELTTEG